MTSYGSGTQLVYYTFPIFYYITLLPAPLCKFVFFLVLMKKVVRDMKRTQDITTPEFLLVTSVSGIYESMMFPVLWFMEYLPGQARYILAACLFLKMIGDVWAFQRKQRGR
ncbi:hypothetical protein WA026_010254 [Henosepilachna vigintioctopunctata]|uniref:Uncharacterized protein n=1 Tax=Henosepilachna vigintioctopunctata TaxID=420089 RepID=A0AAW1UBJ0_9CUCU